MITGRDPMAGSLKKSWRFGGPFGAHSCVGKKYSNKKVPWTDGFALTVKFKSHTQLCPHRFTLSFSPPSLCTSLPSSHRSHVRHTGTGRHGLPAAETTRPSSVCAGQQKVALSHHSLSLARPHMGLSWVCKTRRLLQDGSGGLPC